MATEIQLPHEQTDSPAQKPVAGSVAKTDDDISLLDLLIVLAERRRIIFWVTTGSAILAVVVSLLLPKKYTAVVTLLPPQQNTSLATALTNQLGNLGGLVALAGGSSSSLKNPIDMYVSMLKSETVENSTVQRFGLMEEYNERYLSEARKEFESHAKVDGGNKDGLIHISIDARTPQRAAELANGYVDQFRKLSQQLAITEASQRRLFFGQELEQAKNNLGKAEEALKLTQQQTGMIQLDSQARTLIASAASVRAAIAAKEVQVAGMRTYATGENAQLIEAERQLDGLRKQLAKLGGSQDADSNDLLISKGRVPEAGLEYVRKLREVKYYETIFDILARQFEAAKLDEAKEGAQIQVVDAAVPPEKRSFPKRGSMVMISTAAGFFVGIFAALLHFFIVRLKADPEARAKIALLGSLLGMGNDHHGGPIFEAAEIDVKRNTSFKPDRES